MPYVPRFITQRLHSLASAFPAVVVIGARQVGKSTLVQETFGKVAQTVGFDPVVDVENARRDPDLFLNNRKTPLILDEIQYAPELVAAIKRRIDRDRTPGQYLMTGSQQWGVLKTMAEGLAGRVVFLDLDGFCLGEVANPQARGPWLSAWMAGHEGFLAAKPQRLTTSRTLYEQLWRGWLPEAQFLALGVIPDFHQAYHRTYIERDARLLTEVSDWQSFGRFVRLVSALTAQEINYSQLGRELGLTPQTSRRWLDVLVATFQWFEVPAYSGTTIKRVSLKPKGYLADTGLVCSSQAMTSPQAVGGHPLWGALFETAVAAELRKQTALMSPRPNLYHWRSHGGAEVDFLLERDGVFYPIEAKATSMPRGPDTRGIKAFRETYPDLKVAKGLVLAPTEKAYALTDNDVAVPWDIDGIG